MGAADRPETEAAPGGAPPIAAPDAARLLAGTHDDPFAVLGPHCIAGRWAVRTLLPGAETAALLGEDGGRILLSPLAEGGLFGAWLPACPGAYRLEGRRGEDRWETGEPYRFGPLIGALDEHLIGEGTHLGLWRVLGAHPRRHEGADGAAFAVWAPNARRVSVVGDFNHWDGRRAAMRRRGSSGVWEIFLPDLGAGTRYKYEILGADGRVHMKADPVGFAAEARPGTCSVLRGLGQPAARLGDASAAAPDHPVSIYEAHLGSWARAEGGGFLSWDALAERIVPHAAGLGFTHLEVLPISEHPFDGSWGYQPVGLFAPTARHGDMDGFRRFVAACHRAGLGLLLDWVPAHFPNDPHGLARFDGTALYEHADPREGQHRDWGTLIYNFGRREVANFLVANALYWVQEHGVDGLRVDAVASMLYRDYSRPEGQWVPNVHGGRENLEAVAFLRRLNETLAAEAPGAVAIAEESTAWPGVSRPVAEGGLGFAYKWNMGWMHDTLGYMAEDPMHRAHHHGRMSFGLHYAFSENFVLPLSHDEVVHGKGSILGRMPGDRWTKFANLRAYYAFMWAHPGKKLLFMGQEYGQEGEWSHDAGLPWDAFGEPLHAGTARLVGDLNRLYRQTPALHARDCRFDGFEWIDGAAAAGSVYAWARWGEEGSAPVLAVFNFSGVEHRDWRVGVPREGCWAEILNSDAAEYGGAGRGNLGGVRSEPVPAHGRPASVRLTLPPLTGLWLEHRPGA